MNRPPPASDILNRLHERLRERKEQMPADSYVANLFRQGRDRILQKVGEEAVEVVLAGKNGDPDALVRETADLWFHTLVMLTDQDIPPGLVLAELAERYAQQPPIEE